LLVEGERKYSGDREEEKGRHSNLFSAEYLNDGLSLQEEGNLGKPLQLREAEKK